MDKDSVRGTKGLTLYKFKALKDEAERKMIKSCYEAITSFENETGVKANGVSIDLIHTTDISGKISTFVNSVQLHVDL